MQHLQQRRKQVSRAYQASPELGAPYGFDTVMKAQYASSMLKGLNAMEARAERQAPPLLIDQQSIEEV